MLNVANQVQMYCGKLEISMEENRKTRKMSNNELQEKYSDLEEQMREKVKILEKLDSENKALTEKNHQLKKDNERVEKEKDEALSRLSKLAGQKLMKGNPAIADLGNPNRPAKVAERWGSLYTDEWSDAYEEITDSNQKNKRNDVVPEKQLMEIVVWCYEKCKELEETHRKTVEEKIWNAARHVHVLENESEMSVTHVYKEKCSGQENEDLLQTMESFVENALSKRQCSSSLMESVKNKCLNDYKKGNQSILSAESDFVQKCAELCWLMRTADPPMVIEFQNFEAKPMDSIKFNKYEKTGSSVEFVVWPVLLLHKDGPVLSKGTVQTCSTQDPSDMNTSEESSNPVSQPPVKCNGGIMDNKFGLVVGATIDNTEQYAKESSKTANSDSLDSEEPVDVEIIDEKNEKTEQILPHEESKTKIETNTGDGDSDRNGSSNEKPKSDDKDHQPTEETKPVVKFKASVKTLIQGFKNNNVNKLGTKDPVIQSLSPVKEDKTISKNLGNNKSNLIENRVAIAENDNEQCQSHDSNASTGRIVSPKTKYFVKPDKIDDKKEHTGTLTRQFVKHLQKTKVPRQLSVDKHQPY